MRIQPWLAFATFALSACPSNSVCAPGASVACVAPGGCNGGQVCRADGSGYEACICGSTDAGMTDTGMTGLDTGITDTGVTDTGPLVVETGVPSDTPADVPPTTFICDSGLEASTVECASCMSTNCCAEATACLTNAICMDCLSSGGAPGCSPDLDALFSCQMNNCSVECPIR